MRNYINKLIASICILHRMVNSLSSYPQVGAYLFKIKNTPFRGVTKTFNLFRLCSLIVQIGECRIGKIPEWLWNTRHDPQTRRQDFDNRVKRHRYALVGYNLGWRKSIKVDSVLWECLVRRGSIKSACLPLAVKCIKSSGCPVYGSRNHVQKSGHGLMF